MSKGKQLGVKDIPGILGGLVLAVGIIYAFNYFDSSDSQADVSVSQPTNSEVIEDKPVSNQAGADDIQATQKAQGVSKDMGAFFVASSMCFKSESEIKNVKASYKYWPINFDDPKGSYAYRVTYNIPESTILTHRVPGINGHTCHIYVDKEFSEIMAQKDVCQALCEIPVPPKSRNSAKAVKENAMNPWVLKYFKSHQ